MDTRSSAPAARAGCRRRSTEPAAEAVSMRESRRESCTLIGPTPWHFAAVHQLYRVRCKLSRDTAPPHLLGRSYRSLGLLESAATNCAIASVPTTRRARGRAVGAFFRLSIEIVIDYI